MVNLWHEEMFGTKHTKLLVWNAWYISCAAMTSRTVIDFYLNPPA